MSKLTLVQKSEGWHGDIIYKLSEYIILLHNQYIKGTKVNVNTLENTLPEPNLQKMPFLPVVNVDIENKKNKQTGESNMAR